TNWATAATNIQQAVDAAAAGGDVGLTNGVYTGGGLITNQLTLRSLNGPQGTIINGWGTKRGLFLFQDSTPFRLPLSNGYAYNDGGAVVCNRTNAFLTNCTVVGNSADSGGGAARCTLSNCTLSNNFAVSGGAVFDCTLYNCLLTGNSATEYGGGAYY